VSILIHEHTKVLVQGLGRDGAFHAGQMLEYGTNVVAGVHPGKGGTTVETIPVFNTSAEAVDATGAECSIIFVPASFAADAILEASNAGIKLVVAVSEGIPVLTMTEVVQELDTLGTSMVGPNCPGLISPGKSKVGIMPGRIFKRGNIGVISRSGTLTYEVVDQLTRAGLGQTTAIGMGGDPVVGLKFIEYMDLFEKDPETEAMVMVGEIGGTDEEDAAEFIGRNISKPVVGFIVGRSAPPGKRMGHAGAIVSGGTGTAESKVEAMEKNGIPVAETIVEIAGLLKDRLGGMK
jgi:succinyl-CoA synthetase alpha subunit